MESRDDDLDLAEFSQERKSGQSSSRQHASRPEAMPLDFLVRPQSKIDPDEIRARAKQVIHDQRRLKPNSIFLLAGQSNMSGRGGVAMNNTWDGFVPPECRPNRNILRLTAALAWVPAIEPLHKDINVHGAVGVGPGMSFANSVLARDSRVGVVGLVPCAVGGTAIGQWGRGSFLYGQLVRRASAAVQGGGKIKGMLWYQGESETASLKAAELYKGRLEKFFVDVRSDLKLPLLPIIQVALASGLGPYTEKVREAQLGLNLTNVECVDAKGLQLEPDYVHLTTQAEVQLGKMLADSFLHTEPV